jgi:hypothetical protein
MFCDSQSLNDLNTPYEELDKPITLEEISKAVKFLKRGKPLGSDNLMNEYFIEGFDIIGAHLCD